MQLSVRKHYFQFSLTVGLFC